MLRKMRQRFILVAMAAFAAVMFVLIIGINLVNRYHMRKSQDEMIGQLKEYDAAASEKSEDNRPPIGEMPWAAERGEEFTTRFFSVHCDKNGEISVFGQDYINSIDQDAAESFTKEAINRHQDKGAIEEYRYIVFEEEDELVIIFLNVADDVRFQRNLLMISVIIGVAALAAVFLLIVIFSKRAIRPFQRNIERQKQFITDAGHELKTPITSIATSADIAAMEHENDRWLINIQNQTKRLSKLTSQLIELSRLDEEIPFAEMADFSLSEAAWEVSEQFLAQIHAKQIRYDSFIEENLIIRGDRESIQKMLSILLENAVQYTDEGGRIRLQIKKRKRGAKIEIYNTCELEEGIELERLFDRFYRPDSSRSKQTGGTGIGLSAARAIAEAHGGRITASAPDGHSVLFSVRL